MVAETTCMVPAATSLILNGIVSWMLEPELTSPAAIELSTPLML